MNAAKIIELKKVPGTKGYLHSYHAIENGEVIATRNSNRDYVAAYVMKDWYDHRRRSTAGFALPFCFSRTDLIGKGNSKGYTPYAIAVLQEYQADVVDVISIETDRGSVTIMGIDPGTIHF